MNAPSLANNLEIYDQDIYSIFNIIILIDIQPVIDLSIYQYEV